MAERVQCPACGQRVAVSKKGIIRGHGSGRFSRDFGGGMVCPGAGQAGK